ncbi:cytochrome b561 and DOMON domain-containing protein At3g25290-like [Olea europaea var. sylvestris]|uniref:Cytochrome b561 and DOMON domain-containing protein n=1 Tax=Olea europaea subsp. europaea TaxID=158383 RepID=A0A8S0PEJ6_OLEEU|nr:cytochrome b561 and DOMON domain-containing protein At3g25290-like [Olea europaea var. sylvestris]CAA2940110.1 cytochrome b561 and DOMON domain-containing At3g25290-like [Olea europaea subsp. europaea]
MAFSVHAIALLLVTFFLISPSNSATCNSQTFTNKKLYTFCNDLPSLNSFLHWTYEPANSTLSVAFIAPPASPDGWISWAINPTGTGMVGAQALIAFRNSKGAMTVKTYNITSYGPVMESRVWYDVKESSAETSGGMIRLFATLVLPANGKTMVNHVWQVGSSVTKGVPNKHGFQPENLNSKGSLDLFEGKSAGIGESRSKKKNIHGILNALSWGIMFPLGIILARYLRMFPSADPAWFYLHVFCQVSAYVIGVAGWGTGIKLGSESEGIQYTYHRNIGISLFALATVQIFALFLRPGKDHKYRIFWNIYHHGIGYTILVLGIINVFKGLDILNPEQQWRTAYTILILILGGNALLLEVITWIIVVRRKSIKSKRTYYDHSSHGSHEPL